MRAQNTALSFFCAKVNWSCNPTLNRSNKKSKKMKQNNIPRPCKIQISGGRQIKISDRFETMKKSFGDWRRIVIRYEQLTN